MNRYDDIMTPTGKNNKVILTSNNIFDNAKCMFIEYNDVINSPYYVFLINMIRNNTGISYFNFNQFNRKSDDLEGDVFEWYINRKSINPFYQIGLRPVVNELIGPGIDYEEKRESFLDQFLCESLIKNPDVFNSEGYLNFTTSVDRILSINNLVNKVIIYSEIFYEGISNDIKSLYGSSVEYVTGDLIEVLNKDNIPKDTTYVFSDINKVYALKDTNRLNNSAILIADKFGYNYNNDGKLILDLSLLGEDKYIINTFDNVHKLVMR